MLKLTTSTYRRHILFFPTITRACPLSPNTKLTDTRPGEKIPSGQCILNFVFGDRGDMWWLGRIKCVYRYNGSVHNKDFKIGSRDVHVFIRPHHTKPHHTTPHYTTGPTIVSRAKHWLNGPPLIRVYYLKRTCDIASVFLEDVGRRLEDVLEDVHPSRTEPWKTWMLISK